MAKGAVKKQRTRTVLDPVDDFDTPVRREPEQTTMPAGEPGPPQEVQNGMVLMQFVHVKPSKDRSGKKFIGLELSVGLTDESAALFGKAIEDRYEILRDDAGVKDLSITDMGAHTIDVAIAADMKPVIHATILPERVGLSAVQEKGSGEERTVIRLSFVAPVPQTDPIALWGCNNHGELVWISMGALQGKLSLED
jgi:hypothetical protein